MFEPVAVLVADQDPELACVLCAVYQRTWTMARLVDVAVGHSIDEHRRAELDAVTGTTLDEAISLRRRNSRPALRLEDDRPPLAAG